MTTLMGRRRPIPELRSSQVQTRRLGERLAVNTVIQGTAADIIKVAMVALPRGAAPKPGSKTRLILQIHDELLFEGPPAEMEEARGAGAARDDRRLRPRAAARGRHRDRQGLAGREVGAQSSSRLVVRPEPEPELSCIDRCRLNRSTLIHSTPSRPEPDRSRWTQIRWIPSRWSRIPMCPIHCRSFPSRSTPSRCCRHRPRSHRPRRSRGRCWRSAPSCPRHRRHPGRDPAHGRRRRRARGRRRALLRPDRGPSCRRGPGCRRPRVGTVGRLHLAGDRFGASRAVVVGGLLDRHPGRHRAGDDDACDPRLQPEAGSRAAGRGAPPAPPAPRPQSRRRHPRRAACAAGAPGSAVRSPRAASAARGRSSGGRRLRRGPGQPRSLRG